MPGPLEADPAAVRLRRRTRPKPATDGVNSKHLHPSRDQLRRPPTHDSDIRPRTRRLPHHNKVRRRKHTRLLPHRPHRHLPHRNHKTAPTGNQSVQTDNRRIHRPIPRRRQVLRPQIRRSLRRQHTLPHRRRRPRHTASIREHTHGEINRRPSTCRRIHPSGRRRRREHRDQRSDRPGNRDHCGQQPPPEPAQPATHHQPPSPYGQANAQNTQQPKTPVGGEPKRVTTSALRRLRPRAARLVRARGPHRSNAHLAPTPTPT